MAELPVDRYSPESLVTVMVMLITFLLGVPGNLLVIWLTSVKMKRTVNTVWFCNLALADLTCCLSLPFSIALEFLHQRWPYGSFLCKVLPSVVILNMFASVFTLVAISMDRCLLVVKPVWAQNHRSVRSARFVCLGICLLSFLMCLPAMLYRETSTYQNTTTCQYTYTRGPYVPDYDYNYDTMPGSSTATRDLATEPTNDSSHHAVITIARAVFGFLLPALIISACYIRLAWKMQNARFNRMSRKTRKVVFSIVLAFYVSWAPYHLVGLTMLHVDSPNMHHLDSLSQALAYSNSCINPILYVFMGKDFKSKLRRSLLGLIESALSEEATKSTSRSRSRVSAPESVTL
ncbi:C3a anaphylatoxin chemotactic receptor [Spea bombifrons]|uniref:C3a anaphylatoxin chemotactic receptor n=1 Tax=Spea bombifrons TaxID=233779 RepID=UPI00234ABED7|nr:C3a anaphylatoxin chemotactic receptor [Spea bombifrons]